MDMTPTELRSVITLSGYSVRGLARALGVAQPQVSKWLAGVRPIPEHHATAIIRLTDTTSARRSPADMPSARSKERRGEVRQPRGTVARDDPVNLWSGVSEALTEILPQAASVTAPVAVTRRPATKLPAIPARRHQRAPPVLPPEPMYWGAPPFVGQEPAPGSPIHYPGHWAQLPVMPPPPPPYISPAAGPQHSDIVAAHNRASQRGEWRDVRSDAAPEFPLGQFFGLTMPIRSEDREAFEAQLTRHAIDNGFGDAPEVRMTIEALRTAVRRHNQKF